jgi:uncharacterized protein (TIGR03435 family)
MRTQAVIGVALIATSQIVLAQHSSAGKTFDVVSIKRNTSGSGSMGIGVRGDRFVASNTTLSNLILNGYPYERFRLFAVPAWADTERYDVTASGAARMTRDQLQSAIRAVLADRFGLKAHAEIRRLRTYALVVARPDGQLGPRLRHWHIDCDALKASKSVPDRPFPKTLEEWATPPVCSMRGGTGVFAAGGVSLDYLVRSLAGDLGTPITDHTGLEGQYEISLRWNPDPGGNSGDPSAPSLFAAIQEQLGLKLEARREPVEVLVLDRIDRPTEN